MPNFVEKNHFCGAQKKQKTRKWGFLNKNKSNPTNGTLQLQNSLGYEKDILGGVASFKFINPSVMKTIKFRAVTLLTTLGITWVITGSPIASLGVTVVQQSTNTMVYYFFEQNEKQKKEEQKPKQKGYLPSS